ncbi:hypothetical protein AKO1_013650 [Acrasis kona]|uniref:Myb-like domain-containing protein n=1 Tax=Acrasis kona TaxID=1008807 RepID=A0AAW2YW44_9EUKA
MGATHEDEYIPTTEVETEDDNEDLVDEDYSPPDSSSKRRKTKSTKNSDKKSSKEGKRRSRHSFSEEEEEKLKYGVVKFKKKDGTIDWKKVTAHVNPDLTLRQVFQRYYRVTLSKKKHKWSENQSIELLHYVKLSEVEDRCSVVSMSEISKRYYNNVFPDTQLRHHYDYHCKNNKELVKKYESKSVQEIEQIIINNTRDRSKWEVEPKVMDEPRRLRKKVKLEHVEEDLDRSEEEVPPKKKRRTEEVKSEDSCSSSSSVELEASNIMLSIFSAAE